MSDESTRPTRNHPHHHSRDDGEDLIITAQAHLRASTRRDGKTPWETTTANQKRCLKDRAESRGIFIELSHYADSLKKGGQEHEVIPKETHYLKITRSGYFGFQPGIELAMVNATEDARRFHLWEATPWEYLERLRLQNLLTNNINTLIGFTADADDLAFVISQPRFKLIPVTQDEIDQWFISLGFEQVTNSAYYRKADNLAIFDAHDKNVIRSSTNPNLLIPFDIIPVQPSKGFLKFIQDTLSTNATLQVIRSSHTTTRSSQ
jgi:hypothetical protein